VPCRLDTLGSVHSLLLGCYATLAKRVAKTILNRFSLAFRLEPIFFSSEKIGQIGVTEQNKKHCKCSAFCFAKERPKGA
jgi:hypothetical protein